MAFRNLANSRERISNFEFQSLASIQIKNGDVCSPLGIGKLNPAYRSQPCKDDENSTKCKKSTSPNYCKTSQRSLDADIALVTCLKEFTRQKDLCNGSALHARVAEAELHKENIFIGSALVSMYAKCGALAKAQEIFNELPAWDVVSWTALITGYAHHGHSEEAFKCFERMQCDGLSPDALTFSCIVKACGCMGAADKGRKLHAEIIKKGLHENNTVLSTAIVDMYAKCGVLERAHLVFDELTVQDLVSWTALILGYCQHGHGEEALLFFEKMKLSNVLPGAMTFASVLKACSGIGAADTGRGIHTDIVKRGLVEDDSVLGVALVDMYAKCHAIAEAEHVFDSLERHDTALWNALFTGYCQHGMEERAVTCYEIMRQFVQPDAVTFACILKACGSLGAVEKGKEIHGEIMRSGWLEKLSILGSAMVDMYAKCGALTCAQEVFDRLSIQDVFSWTALLDGYGQHGHGEQSISMFDHMKRNGCSPDAVAFMCILKTCSGLGATAKGENYFESMGSHMVLPTLEHCNCMADLFGQSSHFEKAVSFLSEVPSSNNLPAWYALMTACRWWGNSQVGRFVFEQTLK